MNRIDFDEPKLKEMNDFLEFLYSIGKNSSIDINEWLVYRELCKYNLGSDGIKANGDIVNCRGLFVNWINRNNEVNSQNKGLILKHDEYWPAFLQYYSPNAKEYFNNNRNYIKLYIPMKQKNLFSCVNVLFDYIRDAKILHISKVADKIRSDNVVVRIPKNDIESAQKIISFIENNNTIKNNLNKPNPFVPTVNGIGLMFESGISYNSEMAKLISNYIKECLIKKEKPMISSFYKWFKNNNISSELDEIFSYAIGVKKYIETDEKLSEKDKYKVFNDAIKATFLKYNMNQIMTALKKLLENNDYSLFTNGNGEVKYRHVLRENVTKEDAIKYISSGLPEETEIDYQSVLYYCQSLLKKESLTDFCDGCLITLNNYSENQLKKGLIKKITDNDVSCFSRYSKTDTYHEKNYRTIIASYDKNGIINLMKLFLDLKNIQYDEEDVNNLIDLFVENINSLDYQNEDKQNKI